MRDQESEKFAETVGRKVMADPQIATFLSKVLDVDAKTHLVIPTRVCIHLGDWQVSQREFPLPMKERRGHSLLSTIVIEMA